MRIRLVMGLAVAGLGLSTTFACSSATPPFQEVSEYCTAYANAICGISSTCGFDPGPCETYQDQQCSTAATAAQASGTRQYKPQNVQACISAVSAAYGNGATTVTAATITAYTNLCDQVFVGSAGEGATCASNYDCSVSGDICSAAPGLGMTCAKPTQKQLNDVCADPGDQCPSSAYCGQVMTSTGTTNECIPAQTNGQACSTTQPCDGNDQCLDGTCQALGAMSAPCNTNADCESGLFCDTFTSAAAPIAQCENAYQFGGRGSVDCAGIDGTATMGTSSGGGSGSSSGSSSGGGDAGGGDSGTAGDAASGG